MFLNKKQSFQFYLGNKEKKDAETQLTLPPVTYQYAQHVVFDAIPQPSQQQQSIILVQRQVETIQPITLVQTANNGDKNEVNTFALIQQPVKPRVQQIAYITTKPQYTVLKNEDLTNKKNNENEDLKIEQQEKVEMSNVDKM